ncbi:cell growth regulator with EF hand domain protein 1 [Discoglossus pictus]
MLLSQAWGAPRVTQEGRLEQSDNGQIINPFSSGPEQLRLLKEYLMEADPKQENIANLKRHSVILHLFLLHDFDKNGNLDGLELMELLSRILSQNSERKPSPESVILLVDEVLDKQDQSRDGLLSVTELVTPPIYASELDEDTSIDTPHTVHVVVPPPLRDHSNNPPEVIGTEDIKGEDAGDIHHPPLESQNTHLNQANKPDDLEYLPEETHQSDELEHLPEEAHKEELRLEQNEEITNESEPQELEEHEDEPDAIHAEVIDDGL